MENVTHIRLETSSLGCKNPALRLYIAMQLQADDSLHACLGPFYALFFVDNFKHWSAPFKLVIIRFNLILNYLLLNEWQVWYCIYFFYIPIKAILPYKFGKQDSELNAKIWIELILHTNKGFFTSSFACKIKVIYLMNQRILCFYSI